MWDVLDSILNVIGWSVNHMIGTMFFGLGVVGLCVAVVVGGGLGLIVVSLFLIGLGVYFWL
jgi:hypothetical protein